MSAFVKTVGQPGDIVMGSGDKIFFASRGGWPEPGAMTFSDCEKSFTIYSIVFHTPGVGVFFRFSGQKTADRKQRTENRGQMTEDRKQRTDDRGQMAEDR